MASFELDGFEPIKRIGGGGFGDVWLARQTNVDREVAVKVGHAPIQDEIIKLRFDRECRALGRLSGHPNIVDVYTAGTLLDGRPYLVLEYVDGGTLWQKLKRHAVDEPTLLGVGEQLASALDQAHTSGVLHRDLKPENILMRSTGEAVLGDFGIARLQDGANTTSAAITASVAYAAPEVLGGTKASVASDIYGIGICLLAALLRSVPFVDKSDKSIHPIISRVMNEMPPELQGRGISDDTAQLVESLLAKDPAQRPPDAATVQQRFAALRRAAESASGSASGSDTGHEPPTSHTRSDGSTHPVPVGPSASVLDHSPVGNGSISRSTSVAQTSTTEKPWSREQPESRRERFAVPTGNGVAPDPASGRSPLADRDAGSVPASHAAARVGTGAGPPAPRTPVATENAPSSRQVVADGRFSYRTAEPEAKVRRLSGSAKSFVVAYLATLAVGLLILYLVARFMG